MAIKIAGTEVINDNRELVLAKLTEINTSIADTAVDIFVYDTRKDSDGGAWRKRTQHTSWYNETLNTSTRGSRKEFPAVAVIVAESTQVTIYDGDDPDMPMWMVFNGSSSNLLYLPSLSLTSVTALNGIICVGKISHQFTTLEFISDTARIIATDGIRNFSGASISQRNDSVGIGSPISSTTIVNSTINDVAMTVLPNAPIDAATGLPVPTIAVATNSGVSVIKDDGTVVDVLTSSGQIVEVTYNKDAYLWVTGGGGIAWRNWLFKTNPTSDGQSPDFTFDSGSTPTRFGSNGGYSINKQDQLYETVAFGKTNANSGPAVHLLNDTSMVAFIDPSYNTGWMNGDIKLATLSDTDDTNVTGSELVTNGDFSSATGWTAQSGWSIDTGAGTASCNGTSGAFLYQSSGFPANTKVTISFDITSYTSGSVRAGSTGVGPSSTFSSVGSHSVTYTTASNDPAGIEMYSINFVGTIDNVSARIIEEDRSVNGNGLQVFGTVTKSAVATGADLVAYSGFSTGNYLSQPYNSDLDFGTGDFCYQFWEKHTQPASGTYGWFVDYDRASPTAWVLIGANASGQVRFEIASSILADVSAPYGVWNCWTFVRRNNVCYVYLDGKQAASFSDGGANINASSRGNGLYLGALKSTPNAAFTTGSLALVRVSATAPSPEQIKKIYEDEKVLFQENAQATLYGSSDAVTALAYDDSTDLLHVGTSAGRSVFQGLRRVDNTTTAVGAAISASNGLVADE